MHPVAQKWKCCVNWDRDKTSSMLGRFRSAIYNAIGSVEVEPGTPADPTSLVDTGRSGKVS